jgi:multiple sugar transport system permease protein
MSSWDSYVWPLLVITQQKLMTIPLGLAFFKDEYVTSYNELMAAALIGLAPTFLIFLLFQRQFVEGMTLSGIKG